MSIRKKELGKGIRALLDSIDEENFTPTIETIKSLSDGIISIPLSQIERNPDQPRKEFNDSSLEDLAASIKAIGIIQPITLRKIDQNKYQIIAGERRFRASKMANLEEIPAYIRLANDQELLEMALVENIQREDLNPIEIGISFKRLIEECNLTQENLSVRIGKNRSTISNYMRILKLMPEIQKSIRQKEITMGHARALVGVEDLITQINLYRNTINQGWSVRVLEQKIQEINLPVEKSEPTNQKNIHLQHIQIQLSERFNSLVKIESSTKGNGVIKLFFKNTKQLNDILDQLNE